MKKIRFYLFFYLTVFVLASPGIPLGAAIVTIEKNNPEYLSAGFLKGSLIFLIALIFTIIVHEIVHAIVFIVQGVKLRMIYFFPLRFVWNGKKKNIKFFPSLQLGLGGIVLPQLPIIDSEKDYQEFKRKYRISLLAAPLFSLAVALLSLFLVVATTKYVDEDFQSYYFLFFSALFIFGIFINATSFLNFGGLVGDYSAAKKLKKDEIYSLILLYNLFLLLDADVKKEIRTKKSFLLDKIHHQAKNLNEKIESPSGISIASSSLFEKLMIFEKESAVLNEEELKKIEALFESIENKVMFEVYFRFLQRVIFYLKLSGEKERAITLWERYSEKIPRTKAGIYVIKQVRLALYEEGGGELLERKNIMTSSFDLLLSGIEEYYSDELHLNKLMIGH